MSRRGDRMLTRPTMVCIALAVIASLSTSACGSASKSGGRRPTGAVEFQGMSLLPVDEINDIVDYTEVVAVVTVTAEIFEELPANDDQPVFFKRFLHVSVDEILLDTGVAIETSVTLQVLGAFKSDGELLQETVDGAPHIEVGRQYVVSLIRDGDYWIPQDPMAVFEYPDGRVSMNGHRQAQTIPIDGLTSSELRTLLTQTPRDTIAEEYLELPSLERSAAVAEERSEGDSAN